MINLKEAEMEEHRMEEYGAWADQVIQKIRKKME